MLDEATELVARLMRERDEALAEVERLRAELSSARPAPPSRSKRRHEDEDAWTAMSYYRRAAFWRALRESLTERYAERGGESPAQMIALREQWRDALEAERAVKEALRTKGRSSAARWIALPTSTQSLVLRRIRHISTDVRRGVEREAAAIAATILGAWLKEEVGDELDIKTNRSNRA